MESAISFIFNILILVFSVIVHEVSHGYAALALGDQTAQQAGRLTLNPIPHIDPVGSILVPGVLAFLGAPIIGWARPVPYNPYNLSNQRWGQALVGAAGPAANIMLAVCFGLVARPFLSYSGSTVYFSTAFFDIAAGIVLLNLWLAFFNLMPIPPLDGSKVLFTLLPYQWRGMQYFLEQYGIIFVFLLAPVFAHVVSPIIFLLFNMIVGGDLLR